MNPKRTSAISMSPCDVRHGEAGRSPLGIAIAVVASGVAGEIFFENRARRADKDVVAAPSLTDVEGPELSRDARQSSFVNRNNFKPVSQPPNRERRKLPGRRTRDRVAA